MKTLKGIKIEKIGYGGIGLARMPDGKRILIKGGALPGNIVDLKIVRNKKDYIEAHILEVTKYDPAITDGKVFCPHFFSLLQNDLQSDFSELEKKTKVGCGGCKRQILSYKNQLKLKEDIIQDAFTKIKKLAPEVQILPILASPLEKNYRNKIEFSFGKYIIKEDEKLKALSDRSIGFHKQGEFSKIIDIESCGLISQKANDTYAYIKKLCKDSGLPTYDQKSHQGFFRHLVIREGSNTDQLLINLSVADGFLTTEEKKQQRETLLETFKKDPFVKKNVTCMVITINNGLGDIVHGPDSKTTTLIGEGHIYEKLIFTKEKESTEISFRVSPESFFQTNTLGCQTLFQQAADTVGNIEGTVLDLYCGTGTIGLSFLKMGKGKDVLGIEIVPEAITDARYNAKINGLEEKVYFIANPAEKAFTANPEIVEKLKDLELVVIDPPRDGLHKNVIKIISDLKKEHNFKLLYISCNPITMARDIELFLQEGFTLKSLQPVDMFPQTHHIETIGLLG